MPPHNSRARLAVSRSRGIYCGGAPGNDAVRYGVTVPGMYGSAAAFAAELTISFIFDDQHLACVQSQKAGTIHTLFCRCALCDLHNFRNTTVRNEHEPSTNLGSALQAMRWHALWIYFLAPMLGMLAAAEVFLRARGGVAPYCAKLHHANSKRCIFHHTQQEVSFGEKVIQSEQVNQRGERYATSS
jgi:aquaporin Z